MNVTSCINVLGRVSTKGCGRDGGNARFPSPSPLPLPDLDLDLDLVPSSVMPIESYVTVYTGYVTDNATLSPNAFTESTYLF